MYKRLVDILPENVLEDVPRLYEKLDANAYRIRSGKQEKLRFPAYFFEGWAENDGMNEFKDFVERVSKNKDGSPFTITFYRLPEDARYWEDGEVVGEYSFRVYDGEQYDKKIQAVGSVQPADISIYEKLAELKSENEILKSKIEMLEQELAESEEEKGSSVGWMDLVKDEQARQAVIGLVSNVISSIMGAIKGQKIPLPAAVNGVADVSSVINELKQYDPEIEKDLQRLLMIAKQDKTTFLFLLSKLREMVQL